MTPTVELSGVFWGPKRQPDILHDLTFSVAEAISEG